MTLDDVRADAFRRLADGMADRRSSFRTPALGTIDATGAPSLRTVVLRGFDPELLTLCIHTDLRAAKVAEMRAEPRVSLHVWDDEAQIQVRIRGWATLHSGDARAQAEWDRLHPGSRATYATERTPGTRITRPTGLGRTSEGTAFQHLAVVDIAMLTLEWLRLAPDGQRRARFTFGPAPEGAWLVP